MDTFSDLSHLYFSGVGAFLALAGNSPKGYKSNMNRLQSLYIIPFRNIL